MLVKQLIEKLSSCNQNAEIVFAGSETIFDPRKVGFYSRPGAGCTTHLVKSSINIVEERLIVPPEEYRRHEDSKPRRLVFLSATQEDIKLIEREIRLNM
jgi:hypothetical protein